MKIVHEVNQLDVGGVEKIVRNIIKFDQKNEHTIITYKDGNYRKELEDVGAKIAISGESDVLDIEADVIHIHCGGDISELAHATGLDFPIIETIHSPVRSPNPQSLIAQRVGVSNSVAKMNSGAITILNGLDFETLESKFSREYILEKLGVSLEKPVVGRLGRLGKDKGLEEWILACHYLQQEGIDFTPMIIGSEARNCVGYRGSLKLMCESLPLKNVIWLTETKDVSDYMDCMDVFFYPSPTEGFGLVIAEAMYCGCPVLTYKNSVNFELFGGYAKLVEPSKGIPGLVEALKLMLLNPEYRSEFTGAPHHFVESEYSAERMSKQYQELYEQCYVNSNRKNEPKAEHVLPA